MDDRGFVDISVIIPCLNESRNLKQRLSETAGCGAEIIVVDGGSTDGTLSGSLPPGIRLLRTQPGRAIQMNQGAKIARGEVLLFLHADTSLPETWISAIQNALKAGATAGAFSLALDGHGFFYRFTEFAANLRSRLGLAYGDQGLFVRRGAFWKAGGFAQVSILEDALLWRRLRREFGAVVLADRVRTSCRRWEEHGRLWVTLRHFVLFLGFVLGVPIPRLARLGRERLKPSRKKPGADKTEPSKGGTMSKSELIFADGDFPALTSKGVSLVDFWAPWCGPCRIQGPIVERVADSFEGRVKVGKMNVDENPEKAAELGIRGIPTMIIFRDGAEKVRMVGLRSEEEIKDKLEKLLAVEV